MRSPIFISILCFASLAVPNVTQKLAGGACQSPGIEILKEVLSQISKTDQRHLEKFFRLLFSQEVFGYTLFGEKPISCADFLLSAKDLDHFRFGIIFENGWEAWERNKHLFSSKHFDLKTEFNYAELKTAHCYIINKKEVAKKIEEHFDLFKAKFGNDVKIDQIVIKLCNPDIQIDDILDTQYLRGVFFGYGEENAISFQKEGDLYQIVMEKIFPPFSIANDTLKSLDPLIKQHIEYLLASKKSFFSQPSKIFVTAQEAIKTLGKMSAKRKYFAFNMDEPYLERIASPDFITWGDSDETEILRKKYKRTKQLLRLTYSGNTFLEPTLNQWIDPKFYE